MTPKQSTSKTNANPIPQPLSEKVVEYTSRQLSQLDTPQARILSDSDRFLCNVRKFFENFESARVSNFIELACQHWSDCNTRSFCNIFTSAEFFEGTTCENATSRRVVVEGNSTGLVDIVYAARNQEVQWYRELRAAAAAKRRERENESAKEPSPLKANAEIIVGAIEENAPARDVVNGDVEILDGSSTAAVKSDRRDTGVIKEVTENQDGTATNPLTAISLPPPPPGSTDAVEKKPESDSFDPTMLKFSIFTLELSEKTKNALELHTQLRTIEDLLRTSSTELSKVPGIGPKTLAEIRDGLVTLHYPLGILFDAVDKLPIKGTSIASIIRRIERPHPRCFELLFHSFEAFEAAGVSASDIRMIYEVFKKSGFDFRIK